MDNEPIQFGQPTGPRLPSRRDVLWDELTHLHRQLGMAPPTATLPIEDLEAEVKRLEAQLAGRQHRGRPR